MIDLGRAPLHAEGVTLFFDHADAFRFHFLPDSPRLRLRENGEPELTLLKYRLDPALHRLLGAGLLSLTVDLFVDDDRLKRLARKLAGRLGLEQTPVLAPVAAESGSCELVLIDRSSAGAESPDSPSLVARIFGAASPSLYGTNAATFHAVLDAEGASLVEGALRGGGLPVGVVYALKTSGIRPALRAEIVARWRDAYEFLDQRLHGGKLLLAVDIGPTMEDLVRAEHIQINIDEMVPEAERQETYRQALDHVVRYVIEEFFQPTLGQAPPAPDSEAEGLAAVGMAIKDVFGFFSLTMSLRRVKRDELKTFRYHLGVSRAEYLTLAPQGTFGVLLGPALSASTINKLIIEVPPSASPEMQFDFASLVDLAASEIEHVEITVKYGARTESLMLDAVHPNRTLTLFFLRDAGAAIRYSYEVHFKADLAGTLGILRSDEVITERRAIRLNPRELYQEITVRFAAKGIPFEKYPVVLIDVRARRVDDGATEQELLELTAQQMEATYTVLAAPKKRVLLERRVRYVTTLGTTVEDDWEDIDPGTLIVGDPLPTLLVLPILGSARFGTEVRRLIVEVRPTGNPEQTATFLLTAENPAATWSYQAPEGAPVEYEFRVTVHTMLNEVREGNWQPGPRGKLVVGEGFTRLRQIQLLLLGKTLRDLNALALKVQFRFDDPVADLHAEQEMLIQDTAQPVKWAYPVADTDRQKYTYQLTIFKLDGTADARPPVTTADLLAVQPLL
jgi:hypothetical protein